MTQTLPDEYYKWIEELQELDFVLVELTLYLDTHPDDTAAINQFNDFSYKRRVLKQKIEERYGPLQQFGNSYSNAPWEWSKGPWPWQIEGVPHILAFNRAFTGSRTSTSTSLPQPNFEVGVLLPSNSGIKERNYVDL